MMKIKDKTPDMLPEDLKYIVHAKSGNYRTIVWLAEDYDGELSWSEDLDSAKVYDDKDDIQHDVDRADNTNIHAVEIVTINPSVLMESR